jgi:long-subunit fatty acid transport protein
MAAALIPAPPGLASQLLAIGSGAPDVTLSGATVAEPQTPSAAMFSNPAGLVLFDGMIADFSGGLGIGHTEVDASLPPTYNSVDNFLVLAPGLGFSMPVNDSWRFGFALYGAVGNKFDFAAEPAAGVPDDFFSETGIFTFAPGFAYRVNDRFSVGAALTPLFGLVRSRYVIGGIPFKYKLTGPGIQGMVGARWEPLDGLALGLGLRTPGKLWLEGSSPSPFGGSRQDANLELRMPTQVFAGVTKHLGKRASVSLAVRWTDASTLGDSPIEFEQTPAADSPLVPAAKDEWRVALGVEYLWSDLLTFRVGVGHATAIVGKEGVSPLLFDSSDTRVGAGFGLNFEHFSLDFMAGHAFRGSRRIEADEALALPGLYRMEGQIVMIGATWRR